MSKPKYRWWGYAINVAEDCQRLTESADLLSGERQERDALLMAIEVTRQLPEGEKRLAVLTRVYWNGRKQTIKEAAVQVGVPENMAKQWHGEFIRLVGRGLGFTVADEKERNDEQSKNSSG